MTRFRSDDLLVPQGSSWEVQWPIQNKDGTPANLAGWQVRSQVRRTEVSTEVLYEWSNTLNNAGINNSRVYLTITPEVSSAWTWTVGVYDVEIFHPDGRVNRITQGKIRLDREVTR